MPERKHNRTPIFAPALAVASASAAAHGADGEIATGLWPLFRQSFDIFTIALVVGSFVAVALIVRCVIDLRASKILPRRSVNRIVEMTESGRIDDLRSFVRKDRSLLGHAVRAALDHPRRTRAGMREAAELAASEQTARLFRRLEPLNVIGNLAPLVGLAGTVWGMILAFTALGDTGGQADPGALSIGISKALFHTLLGLVLAIPCLLVFGLWRSGVDKVATRALVLAGSVIEHLPASDEPEPEPGSKAGPGGERDRERK
ncbi:MAG: MotA/TolQ/ExbB proton channel family protein [Phycisphaerales bacterium]|nr:MotA/TolQ/ExbB proton channel family protein [Phycisphaerales bacterium]